MFVNLITEGTNCSPFESEVIVEKTKEVFAIDDLSEGNILQPGQMIWTRLDMREPHGKPLKQCKLRRIVIIHIQQKDIGPGVTHRVRAISLFLTDQESPEIAKTI